MRLGGAGLVQQPLVAAHGFIGIRRGSRVRRLCRHWSSSGGRRRGLGCCRSLDWRGCLDRRLRCSLDRGRPWCLCRCLWPPRFEVRGGVPFFRRRFLIREGNVVVGRLRHIRHIRHSRLFRLRPTGCRTLSVLGGDLRRRCCAGCLGRFPYRWPGGCRLPLGKVAEYRPFPGRRRRYGHRFRCCNWTG